jgi:endonuclease G, mitochondrial
MNQRDLRDKQAVQAAVRQVADEYLRDPNITSVGIGYEVVNGERTDKLVLQFTVGEKIAPEALETAGTRMIPATITADGITFETDVVEREFKPQPIARETRPKPERKRRLDPMLAGISIGHVDITAGTLGCVVKDQQTGEPRILSNWHVLQGATGTLGDVIVQPGSFDDNRIGENRAAVLVRSFIGLAGDCALARADGRGLGESVLELGTAVRKIGDPELGDVVVKSGRTTGVTYGVVTRIHTITKLNYGSAGTKTVGSFEIGPDPTRSAPNGEISMGGDSGSAWLAVDANGAATDMMLGLHFAGETVEPAEYALACYASSVFEKLEIEALGADPSGGPVENLLTVGFDRNFLPGQTIELPAAETDEVAADYSPTRSGARIRDYVHFSLAMSASRRFARWVAWNIDGGSIKKLSRKGIPFVVDPEYGLDQQVDDDLYRANRLDRGHVARRADLLWGELPEASRANVDSFFFTNITPQLDDFNQGSRGGVWGRLEDAIFADADVDDLRVSALGGPIFKPNDFRYRDVLVPRSFWKIIAYVENGTLTAKAFVLTQDDLESKLESLGLEEFKVFQVTVTDLSERTSLDFGNLRAADTMQPAPEALDQRPVRRIRSLADIV